MAEYRPSPEQNALINAGLAAFNQQRFFEAHEHWEDAWRLETEPDSRSALQGLIQVAVAMHHWHRGNLRGARRLMTVGLTRLEASLDALAPVVTAPGFVKACRQLQALLATQPACEPQPLLIPAPGHA